MLILLKNFLFIITLNSALFLILIIGIQNSSNKRKVNLLISDHLIPVSAENKKADFNTFTSQGVLESLCNSSEVKYSLLDSPMVNPLTFVIRFSFKFPVLSFGLFLILLDNLSTKLEIFGGRKTLRVINKNNTKLILSLKCDTKKIDVRKKGRKWKGWMPVKEKFEERLINDYC